MGAVIFPAAHDREEQLRQMDGADEDTRETLHAGSYSNNMGCLCNFRYETAGCLSGQYVRYTTNGCYGRRDTAPAVSAGIWGSSGGLHFIRHTISNQVV